MLTKMDASAELGKKINPSDKKDQSMNGKLLEKLLLRKAVLQIYVKE